MSPADSPQTIAEEAAGWLARHDRGLSPEEQNAFATWRARDDLRAAEFDRLQHEWQSFALAREDPALARLARDLERQTRPRPAKPAARLAPVYYWTFGSLAAAAAAVALILSYRGPDSADASAPAPIARSAAPSYTLAPSAARTETLPDGSTAALRDDTEIAMDFAGPERHVRILRGEAHFQVTKDPDRPFIVTAGPVAVRAVGTAFNVRLGSDAINVIVTEGRVSVADAARRQSLLAASPSPSIGTTPPEEPPVLRAGQALSINLTPAGAPDHVTLTDLSPIEIDRELAWQSTRLIFADTSLAEAVAAFNQHGSRRIELDATVAGHQLIGGVFRVDNVEGFARALELTTTVRRETRPDGSIRLHADP